MPVVHGSDVPTLARQVASRTVTAATAIALFSAPVAAQTGEPVEVNPGPDPLVVLAVAAVGAFVGAGLATYLVQSMGSGPQRRAGRQPQQAPPQQQRRPPGQGQTGRQTQPRQQRQSPSENPQESDRNQR